MPRPTSHHTAPPARLPAWALVAVGTALLAGAVARFATRSPLWLDEALSVNLASLPLGEIGPALERDGHPPLYYWLLHGWMSVFGDGDVAVRALSGVFSLVTLPLAAIAARRSAGVAGAAWALVVLALSPFAVRYATEARMYALVMLLVTGGYVLLGRVLDDPRPWSVALLALTATALLWTHYWTFYLLAAVGLVLLARWWRRPGQRRAAALALSALSLAGVGFLPWLPSFLEQVRHTGTPWAEPSRPAQVLDITLGDLGGGDFAEASVYGMVVAVLLVIAAFGRRTGDGGLVLSGRPQPAVRDEVVVIVLTLGLGALVGYLTAGAYASRYASVVVPLILVVVAVALTRPRGWLLGGLASGLLALGVVGISHNVLTSRTQSEDLASIIAAEGSADDVVVVCPDQLGPSLTRALDQLGTGITPVAYPAAGDPRFVDWRDYRERNDAADPAAFAQEVLEDAGSATVWVVWHPTYRTFEGDCEALIGALGVNRPTAIRESAEDVFEPASLYRIG